MNCKKSKILMSTALDGELSRSETLALERHLETCAKCREEQSEMSALKQTMALWTDEEPSPWLAENFAESLRKLRNEAKSPSVTVRRRWTILGPATAALATAALAIAFLVHYQFQPEPARIATPPPTVEYQEATPFKPEIAVVPEPKREVAPAEELKPKPSTAAPTKPPVKRLAASSDLRIRTDTTDTEIVRAPNPSPSVAAAPDVGVPGGPTIAQTAVAHRVVENLGEAGLTMNMTVERVRGNLQKSVDILISSPPVPAADTNGGNLL